METLTIISALGVFFAVLALGTFIFAPSDRQERQINSRLKGCQRLAVAETIAVAPPSSAKSLWSNLLPLDAQAQERYQQSMIQAGFYQPGALALFFMFRLSCLVLPVSCCFAATQLNWLPLRSSMMLGAGLGIVGIFLPSFWLERRIKRRISQLQRALPDFLDMLTICLGSGLGLQAAILRVVDEINLVHPLLAKEMEIVVRDMQLGSTVDTAFARFAQRTGFKEISTISSMLKESQRYGSDLIAAFEVQADTMRFEREQATEEMAHKASVKLLMPMLLLIMPAVFIVLAGPAILKIQEAFK